MCSTFAADLILGLELYDFRKTCWWLTFLKQAYQVLRGLISPLVLKLRGLLTSYLDLGVARFDHIFHILEITRVDVHIALWISFRLSSTFSVRSPYHWARILRVDTHILDWSDLGWDVSRNVSHRANIILDTQFTDSFTLFWFIEHLIHNIFRWMMLPLHIIIWGVIFDFLGYFARAIRLINLFLILVISSLLH